MYSRHYSLNKAIIAMATAVEESTGERPYAIGVGDEEYDILCGMVRHPRPFKVAICKPLQMKLIEPDTLVDFSADYFELIVHHIHKPNWLEVW